LVAIEGIVALAVGAYMVSAASDARDITRQLIAVVLLVNSFGLVANGLKNRVHPTAEFEAMRGGIGLAVGVIVLLENWSDYLSDDAARYILGLGLLAYGVLGLYGAIVAARGDEDLRTSAIVSVVLTVVLALLLLTGGDETGDDRITLLGAVAVVIDLALVGYALWLRRSARTPRASV
jgi:uncharacterized membrane protein HdeD (DUF308 family)